MSEKKYCYDCTMNGLICVQSFDHNGIACKLFNPRPRCLICNSMLLIDQKVHYSKYTYCSKCKTHIKLDEIKKNEKKEILKKTKEKVCPKCGSECNATEHSLENLYIFCLDDYKIGCNYQTLESKYKMRNNLIHELKEMYKED